MPRSLSSQGVHRFRHEAMASFFELRVCAGEEVDRDYAAQAAYEVFREVDRLENLLSRFREGSDVFRINRLAEGEGMRVSFECAECLTLSARITQATSGAFDPGVGEVMDAARAAGLIAPLAPDAPTRRQQWVEPRHQRQREAADDLDSALQRLGGGALRLEALEVHCVEAGMRIDLGGIGKGYALDRAAEILGRWGIGDALLLAGGSSARALGNEVAGPGNKNGWSVHLAGDRFSNEVTLRERSIGASGTAIQGAHLVDPRRKKLHMPGGGWRRAWVIADRAALADALSTAVMTLGAEEIANSLPGWEETFGERFSIVLEPADEGSPPTRIFCDKAGKALAAPLDSAPEGGPDQAQNW